MVEWIAIVWLVLCAGRAFREYRWLGAGVSSAFFLAFAAPVLIPYFYGHGVYTYLKKKLKK